MNGFLEGGLPRGEHHDYPPPVAAGPSGNGTVAKAAGGCLTCRARRVSHPPSPISLRLGLKHVLMYLCRSNAMNAVRRVIIAGQGASNACGRIRTISLAFLLFANVLGLESVLAKRVFLAAPEK